MLTKNRKKTLKRLANKGVSRFTVSKNRKLSETTKAKIKETKERLKSLTDEELLFLEVARIRYEKENYYITNGYNIPAYIKGLIGVLQSCLEASSMPPFIRNLWEECRGLYNNKKGTSLKVNKKEFRNKLILKLTPNYMNSEIYDKIIEPFTYYSKRYKTKMINTKPFVEGKEYGKRIISNEEWELYKNKAIEKPYKSWGNYRTDAYMFANNNIPKENGERCVRYDYIVVDIDVPLYAYELLATGLPINFLTIDKHPLEKIVVKIKDSVCNTKKVKDWLKTNNLADKVKMQALISLKESVWGNNPRLKVYLDIIRKRIEYFLAEYSIIVDPRCVNVVCKNVANNELYQSFLISEKRISLEELNEFLDKKNVPSIKAINQFEKDMKEEAKRGYKPLHTSEFYDLNKTIAVGLAKKSRNCELYIEGIYSACENFTQLVNYLNDMNKSKFANNPLPEKEVLKIASSIFEKSFIFKGRLIRKDEETRQADYAQKKGNLANKKKSLKIRLFIDKNYYLYAGMSKRKAAKILCDQFYVVYGISYSVDYVRKLLDPGALQKFFQDLEKLENEVNSVNFERVKRNINLLLKDDLSDLNYVLATYMFYKIAREGKYYSLPKEQHEKVVNHLKYFINNPPNKLAA